MKSAVKVVRVRTGAPDYVWYQLMEYMADVHNHTADETLGWITPIQKRHGITPDISPYLQFKFWEPIYYLDNEETFPGTTEKLGRWLGVTKHVGHHLCYKVLTDDTRQVIERSVIRSAKDTKKSNKTVSFDPDTKELDEQYEQELIFGHEPIPETPVTAKQETKKELPRRSKRDKASNPYFTKGVDSLFDHDETGSPDDIGDSPLNVQQGRGSMISMHHHQNLQRLHC